jgi:hypothetical protein
MCCGRRWDVGGGREDVGGDSKKKNNHVVRICLSSAIETGKMVMLGFRIKTSKG